MNNAHSCPVCHEPAPVLLGRDANFDVWRCARCEAGFVHPLPTAEALNQAYADPAYFGGELRGGYRNYDAQTEPILPTLATHLDRLRKPGTAQSLLDYGCGFGSHLQLAADCGWECYGVELSDHARSVTQQRLGMRVSLGKRVADLIPHCYDVVLLLDVIEHLPRPQEVFYELFRFGCIMPHTTVLITTPNGGCTEAISDLLRWAYFHPPYHLINYSAAALVRLFQELRFTTINISGIHPQSAHLTVPTEPSADFDANLNTPLRASGGLLCETRGSDFHHFMQERFVPGTWSALSAWEHYPRYLFAKTFASGKRVLDFGCGSGYGTALLATSGADVLGLDISSDALSWAQAHHRHPSLRFAHTDKANAAAIGLFDLITCFEVIEHLSEPDQEKLITRFTQALAPDGRLLISTPNPRVTAQYGDNPYHLHELDRPAFEALLRRHFQYLDIYSQDIRTATIFVPERPTQRACVETYASTEHSVEPMPACWLAICSHRPNPVEAESVCSLDTASDPIAHYLATESQLNQLKLQTKQTRDQLIQTQAIGEEIARLNEVILQKDQGLKQQAHEIHRLEAFIGEKQALLQCKTNVIGRLHHVIAHTGSNSLIQHTLSKLRFWQYVRNPQKGLKYNLELPADFNHAPAEGIIAGWIFSERNIDPVVAIRCKHRGHFFSGSINLLRPDVQSAHPLAGSNAGFEIHYNLSGQTKTLIEIETLHSDGNWRMLTRSQLKVHEPESMQPSAAPYIVRVPKSAQPDCPHILHLLANFMVGGSSRLVIDLIEHLGSEYNQSIVTGFAPNPPAYAGISITEIKRAGGSAAFVAHLRKLRPAFLHVHYWGDIDESWYALVFSAASQLGIPVVQNINTPVAPYISPSVQRNIYVSETVRREFGGTPGAPVEETIYPGSDFSRFTRPAGDEPPENCIGMVYRLEVDKLNSDAIQPFIHCVNQRPGTRVLIVGGGSLLVPFQSAVDKAGLAHAFEFTGYVPYESLPDIYRRMSIFVAPVWKESFGQVSPFAMNMRIPVIGYDVGAIPEIIDDRSLLAPAGDAQALGNLMASLLDNRPQRLAIGTRNTTRAGELFSVEVMIARYRDIYAQVRRLAL